MAACPQITVAMDGTFGKQLLKTYLIIYCNTSEIGLQAIWTSRSHRDSRPSMQRPNPSLHARPSPADRSAHQPAGVWRAITSHHNSERKAGFF